MAARIASVALRPSALAVRDMFSKLSMTPLVAVEVFSVSIRLTAVARSSAVFRVSAMMRVKDRMMPSSSSLRRAQPGREILERRPPLLDRGLDLAVDLGEVAGRLGQRLALGLEALHHRSDALEDVVRNAAELLDLAAELAGRKLGRLDGVLDRLGEFGRAAGKRGLDLGEVLLRCRRAGR